MTKRLPPARTKRGDGGRLTWLATESVMHLYLRCADPINQGGHATIDADNPMAGRRDSQFAGSTRSSILRRLIKY
jgi:hypothetical protein